ncbi:glycosyltransferase family protein [Motilimonas sp. 1_MG-2023]|uniref:glycosyltransferase family protein n=1 Tax=Motilimonas TaxID=1914248 RepID=UPI0026E379F9|nr:glycosyltransferase family protein [Motilimonas sp. 1_MG-2023]MDO6524968.1 glycosyltransferase family protein [Motilimonas sp. 1_MG-2023]
MILAILQARMSSQRLPKKVLKQILGEPMLAHQIRRIRASKKIDKLVIATSDQIDDSALVAFAQEYQVEVFQGSLNDVLARFYHCACHYKATHIVRLTGDCPLSDAKIIDNTIALHINQKADYSSNCHPATFADGFDVEVITFDALQQAYYQAQEQKMREHVTLYLAKSPDAFVQANLTTSPDTSHFRVTVDNQDDFELVSQIYQSMSEQGKDFTYQEIIDWLNAHPKQSGINAHYQRNEAISVCHK